MSKAYQCDRCEELYIKQTERTEVEVLNSKKRKTERFVVTIMAARTDYAEWEEDLKSNPMDLCSECRTTLAREAMKEVDQVDEISDIPDDDTWDD